MKVFNVFQRNLLFLGFNPTNPFDKKILGCFSLIALTNTMCLVFLISTANTFIEYTQSIYFTAAIFAISIVFTCFVLQIEELFKIIDEIQKHVNGKLKSQSNLTK